MKSPNENGFTIAIALIVALCMGILVVALAKILEANSKQKVYLSGMNNAYRLAELGLNKTISKLATDNSAYLDPHFSDAQLVTGNQSLSGRYQSIAYIRNFADVQGGYYIMTSATETASGHLFSCRLHTYARISNVTDYFVAVNDELRISNHADLRTAKVYARKLDFDLGGVSQLSQAEFYEECTPACTFRRPLPGTPDPYWNDATNCPNGPTYLSSIIIEYPKTAGIENHCPIDLDYPLQFPQLLDSDTISLAENSNSYRKIAGPHIKCDFRSDVDIFPPGYRYNPSTMRDPRDSYTGHTTDNASHVYYCPQDMYIQGTIHGQVLFVTTNTLHITGSVISSGEVNNFPGQGSDSVYIESSTAHQGVFITKGTISIDNSFGKADSNFINNIPHNILKYERIEGLFFAPNTFGVPYSLYCQKYGDAPDGSTYSLGKGVENRLRLLFNGSMILNNFASGQNFSDVFDPDNKSQFAGDIPREYSYMKTLKSNPPPYLPALTEIYYSIEENSGGNF